MGTHAMVRCMEFTDLVGSELGSICFVRDYVELNFDGPIFRCMSDPTVSHLNEVVVFPEFGSRDALCSLIGETVESTEETQYHLILKFSNDWAVDVPKCSRVAGCEVAHLVPYYSGRLCADLMIIWENEYNCDGHP